MKHERGTKRQIFEEEDKNISFTCSIRQVILYKKANIHCTVQCAGNGVHISKNMLEKTCSCVGWAGHSGDSHSRRETDGRESA